MTHDVFQGDRLAIEGDRHAAFAWAVLTLIALVDGAALVFLLS